MLSALGNVNGTHKFVQFVFNSLTLDGLVLRSCNYYELLSICEGDRYGRTTVVPL